MAKSVFRPGEAKQVEKKIMLPLVHDYAPVEEVEEVVVEEYKGPTADELRQEAEEYRAKFEAEKQQMLAQAQNSADEILKKAEDAAFAEVKRQTEQAQIIKADAENEANEIIQKAKIEAERIIADANAEKSHLIESSKQIGYEEGHKEGFAKGEAEVERLVDRMHKILEAVMLRREEILKETETQIVELVVLMSRKVIKILSENQKSVILANVLAALKKVKARGDVILRVNMEDVKLTTEHISEFVQRVENINGITIMEDSSVEKGGCIVETDFGAIDARISSQLTELENKILEVSPVKTIKKSDTAVTE